MKAVSRVVVAVSAGAAVAFAAGCSGGAEGSDGASKGGLLSSVGGTSGEVLYGTPCAEHEDNVLQGAIVEDFVNPLEEGEPYEKTMWSIEQKYFRTKENLFGFGDTAVQLTPEQIESISAGREAIKQDLSEYYEEPMEYNLGMRVNVLNENHEMKISDGHIVGDMCVDSAFFSDELSN